jgi:hypothetical protein
VECVIVGGVAARLHGATRLTADLDLVASYDEANLRRLAAAMRELGATIRLDEPLDAATREASKALVHESFLVGAETTLWDSDAGPFDVLRSIPSASGERRYFEELDQRAVDARYGEIVVRVASLPDVIDSKRWADRPKDRAALPELEDLYDRELGRGPGDASRPS